MKLADINILNFSIQVLAIEKFQPSLFQVRVLGYAESCFAWMTGLIGEAANRGTDVRHSVLSNFPPILICQVFFSIFFFSFLSFSLPHSILEESCLRLLLIVLKLVCSIPLQFKVQAQYNIEMKYIDAPNLYVHTKDTLHGLNDWHTIPADFVHRLFWAP